MDFENFDSKNDILKYIEHEKKWDVFIFGGKPVYEAEERCRFLFDFFSTNVPNCAQVGFYRHVVGSHKNYRIETAEEQIESCFPKVLNDLAAQFPTGDLRILLDITSLELDALLYIFKVIDERTSETEVFASYLFPEEYKKEEPGLQWLKPQQPPGFVSFKPSFGRKNTKHLIILGFDEGRSGRFISYYDWDWESIFPVLGDPSYVENGEARALKVNRSWIGDVNTQNLIKIEAKNPYSMRECLLKMMAEHPSTYLDIVPHGPKPMLLGVILFYSALDPKERERVRILFDYPTPKNQCTTGIKKGFIYPCGAPTTK